MNLSIKHKKVVIMGLGIHGGGVSSAVFFARLDAQVLVTDLKNEAELASSLKKLRQYKNITYVLGKHREDDFKKAAVIIRNPAVPNDSSYLQIARKQGIPVHTDVSWFLSQLKAISYKLKAIIGITGTKGKSTTAALLHHVLTKCGKKALLAGNIRKSPLDFIKIKSSKFLTLNSDFLILELSSWHLESLNEHKLAGDIAIITNILKDHLNRYKSFADYIESKAYIFKHQTKNNVLFLNKSDIESQKLPNKFCVHSKLRWFKAKTHTINFIHPDIITGVKAICSYLKLPQTKVNKALISFKGLTGRMEYIGTVLGVRYYNDTCATQPDATKYAITKIKMQNANIKMKNQNLKIKNKSNLILIAGGSDKKLDYKKLVQAIKQHCSCAIIYKGAKSDMASDKIIEEFKKARFSSFVIRNSLNDCVRFAASRAKHGDTVLFSPAASSFGKFKHEFDRGEKFVRIVKSLKRKCQKLNSKLKTTTQNLKLIRIKKQELRSKSTAIRA